MYSSGKIMQLTDIAVLKKKYRTKRSVLVGGCFDIFHYGHLHFLRLAKQKGDVLIVLLESDAFIENIKQKKPVHIQAQRAEIISALECVDAVVLLDVMKNPNEEYLHIIKLIQPSVIAYTTGDKAIAKKKNHAKAVNADLVEINYLSTFSSSQLITYAPVFRD